MAVIRYIYIYMYMYIYIYIVLFFSTKKNIQCGPCSKQGPNGRWMPSGILCWVPTHPTALATPCHTPHLVWCRTVVAPCERHSPASWRTFETPEPRSGTWACPASSPLSWDHSANEKNIVFHCIFFYFIFYFILCYCI